MEQYLIIRNMFKKNYHIAHTTGENDKTDHRTQL